MPIKLDPLEKTRFGMVAAHVIDHSAPLETINHTARAQSVQLLTARLPADNWARIHALQGDGYHLMDCLVYYERKLGDTPIEVRTKDGVTLRAGCPDDATAVGQISQHAFAGYIGHYHTDPRLPSDKADAAYVEWAETSVSQMGDAPVVIAEMKGQVAGFMTTRRNSNTEGETVLSGVSPDAQGHGLYYALMGQAVEELRKTGSTRVITSTQLTNLAVQKVWVRQGFTLSASYLTFHKWFD